MAQVLLVAARQYLYYTLHEPACTNSLIVYYVMYSVAFNISQVIVMSHKVLPMEAKTPRETLWEKRSTTSVTLGLNFLKIKTEPANLMDSGQERSRCVFVR